MGDNGPQSGTHGQQLSGSKRRRSTEHGQSAEERARAAYSGGAARRRAEDGEHTGVGGLCWDATWQQQLIPNFVLPGEEPLGGYVFPDSREARRRASLTTTPPPRQPTQSGGCLPVRPGGDGRRNDLTGTSSHPIVPPVPGGIPSAHHLHVSQYAPFAPSAPGRRFSYQEGSFPARQPARKPGRWSHHAIFENATGSPHSRHSLHESLHAPEKDFTGLPSF